MYYPGSENKDADQLRGYREADLRLCFRICKKPVFSRHGSFDYEGVAKLQKINKSKDTKTIQSVSRESEASSCRHMRHTT